MGVSFLRAAGVKRAAYDLAHDAGLIISFGTVIKIIFIRHDRLMGLGAACFTRLHAHIYTHKSVYTPTRRTTSRGRDTGEAKW